MKQYIRFIGNRRLTQLGLNPIYDIDKNPLPWMDEMLNGIEHMNFFEGRATEYTKPPLPAHGMKPSGDRRGGFP